MRKMRNTITLTAVIQRDEQGRRSVSGQGVIVANGDGKLSPEKLDAEFVIRGKLGQRLGEDQFELVVTDVEPGADALISTVVLADMLGIQPDSVRKRMARWGVEHAEGWPAARVLPLLGDPR
jgi:hypothetical protein